MSHSPTGAPAPLPDSARQPPGGRLDRLTALRALAAAAVFGYHLGYNLGFGPARRWLDDGYAGVAFFFILSGFVLTWSTDPAGRARDFYVRRVARIYPSYAVANLIAWVLFPAFATASTVTAVFLAVQAWWTPSVASSLARVTGLDAPSWSLSCEAAFYIATPLLLRALLRYPMRRTVAVAALYVIATQVLVAVAPVLPGSANWQLAAYVNPLVRGSEFVLGAVTAHAMRNGWRPRIAFGPAVVVLAGGYVLLHVTRPALPVADAVLQPAFWLIIVAAARADLAGSRSWLTTRPLVYAGEVSFAFYLVQVLCMAKLHETHPGLAPLTASVLSGLIAVIAAVGLHHLVERPAQRLIMGRTRRRDSLGPRSMS